MSQKYLTGIDYDECCANCRKAIDNAHDLIVMGFADDYVDDLEGPSMLAYDKNWLCHGDCYD